MLRAADMLLAALRPAVAAARCARMDSRSAPGALAAAMHSLSPAGAASCAAPLPAASSSARAPAASAMEFVSSIAFVNRNAEALDVLVPNLINHECLRAGQSFKPWSPLAVQPYGTGKTSLGVNLTAILRRPREVDAAAEAVIAERLRTARCWNTCSLDPAALVETALRDPGDENLVMRTLRALFPHHATTLQKFKDVKPIVVGMNMLVEPDFHRGIDKQLAFAIFCAERGLPGYEPKAEQVFNSYEASEKTLVGTIQRLIREGDDAPVVLVLDGITSLRLKRPMTERRTFGEPAMQAAMNQLQQALQLLHNIPGLFVYCTGTGLLHAVRPLYGGDSPLRVHHVVLPPLTASDAQESLRLTTNEYGQTLQDSVGVLPDLVTYLAARVVEASGGAGWPVQQVLRQVQLQFANSARMLTARNEIREAVDRARSNMDYFLSAQRHVDWYTPILAADRGDVPDWCSNPEVQAKLLQLFARMLLLDAPYNVHYAIEAHGGSVLVSDAAAILGLSFGPAPNGRHLRLVAGTWLCGSMATASYPGGCQDVDASAQLLAAMRAINGTMRNRPYEMFCAEALYRRSLASPVATLAQILPHLRLSARAADAVPRLSIVALPNVVRTPEVKRLDDAAKTVLLESARSWMGLQHIHSWTGDASIHVDDLGWLLSTWLPVGSLGVSAGADSISQDLYLRLSGGVIGIAIKPASASAGMTWSVIQDELSKAPVLPPETPYSLVVWSTFLAPELQTALSGVDACVFKEGAFEVPGSVQELIVANPHVSTGSGLQELLESSVLEVLQSFDDPSRGVGGGGGASTSSGDATELTKWMAQAVVQQVAAVSRKEAMAAGTAERR